MIPKTELDWRKKLNITDKDYERIRDIAEFYYFYASKTRDVDTDSITGFLGMVSYWASDNE